MRFDANGRVTAVLFAHPDSLQFVQSYPDILLLDCTYKTNKYGMPLLDMIEVDACQRSFCIAFAFLSGEAEEDYSWALERLRSLYETCKAKFPSVVLADRCVACMNAVERIFPAARPLLCLWHANKAVVQRCKPAFSIAGQAAAAEATLSSTSSSDKWTEFFQFWHSIISSPSEQIFKERVSAFERKYVPGYIEPVTYIRTNWLDLYKERLVKAWVDQHSHFGNVATSRVEGIHALLKAHLRKSTLDLFEAWRAIKHALLNQLSELTSNQAKQQIRTPIELSSPLYNAVRGWISHEALRKVDEQRRLLDKKPPSPSPLCTETFTKSWGLPCIHTLKSLLEGKGVLLLDHFHSHWHLRRNGAPQRLLEPLRRMDSLRKTSRIPQQSTRREPSLFEGIERTKAPPTCSRCHQIGHSRSSNLCRLRHEELLGRVATDYSRRIDAVDETDGTVRDDSGKGARKPDGTSIHPAATKASCFPTEPDAGDGNSITGIIAAEELLQSPGDMSKVLEEPQIPETPSLPEVPGPQTGEEQPPMHLVSRFTDISASIVLEYSSPQAIYARYVAARNAWYAAQPAGCIKTNQLFRKAKGLPLRYDKQSYVWCLDYKQMSKRCVSPSGVRDWTKEEMMAYLDWNREEDDRVEAKVAAEMRDDPAAGKRRGMKHIWESIERNIQEQEALHSRGGELETEDCIFVQG